MLFRSQLIELADKRPADLAETDDARTFGDLVTLPELDAVRGRIAALGVHTTHVFPLDPQGATGALSSLIDEAHARDIQVAAFTLRRENRFLPTQLRIGDDPKAPGDLATQARAFAEAGADALFTDNVDVVREALQQ